MPQRRTAPLTSLVLFTSLALIAVACGGNEPDQPLWTALPAGSGTPPEGSEAPVASGSPTASGEPSSGPRMTDEALGVEVAVDGLTEPTALAFLGPDEFFVTEKSTGEVHRVTGGQAGEPVLDLAVNFFDERGLLGIALHPDFADNGFVYLYWTSSGEGEGDEGLLGPDTDEERALPDLGNRVDRFTWDGTALTFDRNLVQLRSNTLETDTSGRIRGNHDAGPLVFGTDGKLYAVNGDQNLRGQLQNIADGPEPDDANFTWCRAAAQRRRQRAGGQPVLRRRCGGRRRGRREPPARLGLRRPQQLRPGDPPGQAARSGRPRTATTAGTRSTSSRPAPTRAGSS